MSGIVAIVTALLAKNTGHCKHLNALTQIIAAEIGQRGRISWQRFMELALYHPDHGYYERTPGTTGKSGDYYSSVSVGSLFGGLLAFQLDRWTHPMAATKVRWVEAGAHDGRLALDILAWVQRQRPALLDRLEYWILEPSSRRQRWQESTLREVRSVMNWARAWADLPAGLSGCIFSNELLDAFPVHRVGWDAARRTWFEWGVGLEAGRFVWMRLPGLPEVGPQDRLPPSIAATQPADAPVLNYLDPPAELLAVLPDGFTTEICPAAAVWWNHAARVLGQGKLLTLDYGLEADEFFRPERLQGTLRAYRRHQVAADLLADPGEQDLTAHVNFSLLQRIGERAGLKTEAPVSQARFLTRIAESAFAPDAGFGEWTPARLRQFQTLVHPEHLGRSFRVLVQKR